MLKQSLSLIPARRELYQAKQKSSLAREHFAMALSIYKNQLPTEHPDMQRIQEYLANPMTTSRT